MTFAQKVSAALSVSWNDDLQRILQNNGRALQTSACPAPLLDANENNTNFIVAPGFACGFRCEGTMFDQEDIDEYSRAQTITAGVGLMAALFVFLTWGLFPVKSKQKMTFWISFASVMVTSLVFWPSVFKGSGSAVWCKDELEPRRQEDGPSSCVAQGFAIFFFGLVLACWWWCSCFDLFCKLFLRKRDIQHYLKYYHILSWTLPSVCAFAVLFSGKYGYEQPRLWCFLAPDAPGPFEYVFFYGWVGALWISGDIMMMFVVWSLIAHSRSFKKKNPTTNYFKKLSMYKTPLFFVFIFSLFWAVFFSFVVLTDIQTDAFVESASTWVRCLFTSVVAGFSNPAALTDPSLVALLDPAPEDDVVGCGDVQPGRISIGLMWVTVLILSGNGILIFLVFGLQAENFSLWVNYLASGCNKESVAVSKGDQSQKSTFQELREGSARINIKFCQWFAGDSMTDVLIGRDLVKNSQKMKSPDRPILDGEEKYAYPVSPLAGVASFPRASYQKDAQDPFPTRTSQSPASLEQFYRNRGNEVDILQAPPPVRGRQEANGNSRNTQYTVAGWDDIYNDPLWGVNVEF